MRRIEYTSILYIDVEYKSFDICFLPGTSYVAGRHLVENVELLLSLLSDTFDIPLLHIHFLSLHMYICIYIKHSSLILLYLRSGSKKVNLYHRDLCSRHLSINSLSAASRQRFKKVIQRRLFIYVTFIYFVHKISVYYCFNNSIL